MKRTKKAKREKLVLHHKPETSTKISIYAEEYKPLKNSSMSKPSNENEVLTKHATKVHHQLIIIASFNLVKGRF